MIKTMDVIELEALDVWGMSTRGGYRAFVQSPYKAMLVNRYLGYPYGQEAEFVKSSSEGIFSFSDSELLGVVNILKG